LVKIWNPFFSKYPGHAGLGLTICEKIAANHSAQSLARSVPGEFFEIGFVFPLSTLQPTITPLTKSASIEPGGQTVLILDSDETLLDLLRDVLLVEDEIQVYVASTRTEARNLLRLKKIDLIIGGDFRPGSDESEWYRHLKKDHPQARLLRLATDPISEETKHFLQENSIPYLRKPFELMEFRSKVLENLK
jgi:CheY-like chemotaxis protein